MRRALLLLHATHTTAALQHAPWTHTTVDYSAANEYCAAHYGIIDYFGAHRRVVEPVHDARRGIVGDGARRASLEGCGFELARCAPSWDATRAAIAARLSGRVRRVILWHPQHRDERPRSADDASIATAAHIDTDLHAMVAADVARLVARNAVDDDSDGETDDDGAAIVQAIADGRRFAIVNAWRNARAEPISRAPLGLLSTSRDGGRFPFDAPDLEASRWHAYPRMTHDECLLFKQYDRSLARTSDVWHCALPGVVTDPAAPPRRSSEVRAFVLFDEVVPPHLDRFVGTERAPPPRLSYGESACFCDDQARRRRRQRSTGG